MENSKYHITAGLEILQLDIYRDCCENPCCFFPGADVLSQAMDCASILFEAAGGGNPDSVSLLLEYGADANVPKHSGHLPIHRAAYRGHFL